MPNAYESINANIHDELDRQADDLQAMHDEWAALGEEQVPSPQPVSTADRSQNVLRPSWLHEVVGQDQAKRLMRTVIDATRAKDQPLDHTLLVGASGTGKSTFSHIIANELGVEVYEVEAPVSLDILLELREVMFDHDILRIEEIHQQAVQERRGRQSSTQPEVLYALMEDRTITTGFGVLPYPHITVIGTTTDEGMLPDPFVNRFPLRPVLESYTVKDMEKLAEMNAGKLKLTLTPQARRRMARASRRVPRQLNNLMKNAVLLATNDVLDEDTAKVVIRDLNGLTDDGLTKDMQDMLTFLYTRAKRTTKTGDVSYQASVNTIATAIGKSRDSKAISLRVEPYLIELGYVQVGHGGRILTDDGIARARQLTRGRP